MPSSTCKRLESIEALNKAVDELTDVCETVLYGAPIDPAAKVIHVAFRGVDITPLDMAMHLGTLK